MKVMRIRCDIASPSRSSGNGPPVLGPRARWLLSRLVARHFVTSCRNDDHLGAVGQSVDVVMKALRQDGQDADMVEDGRRLRGKGALHR